MHNTCVPRNGQEGVTRAEKAVFIGQFVSPEGYHEKIARVGLGLCADLQRASVECAIINIVNFGIESERAYILLHCTPFHILSVD